MKLCQTAAFIVAVFAMGPCHLIRRYNGIRLALSAIQVPAHIGLWSGITDLPVLETLYCAQAQSSLASDGKLA